MNLGAFSVSLTVKNLSKSIAFYNALGFMEFGGNPEQKWVILKNGDTLIGLFEGMFERNMLTFNPGWDQNAGELDEFDDVRSLQATLEGRGLALHDRVAEDTAGPAHIMLTDPDGNPVLIDQHR